MLSTKCVNKSCIWYMYKEDLALNNLLVLICHQILISAFPDLSIEKIKISVFDSLQIPAVHQKWAFYQDNIWTQKEWLVIIQRFCQDLSWKYTSKELHQNCPETIGEQQNATSNCIFFIAILLTSQKTLRSVMSKMSDSTKIWKSWSTGIRVHEM